MQPLSGLNNIFAEAYVASSNLATYTGTDPYRYSYYTYGSDGTPLSRVTNLDSSSQNVIAQSGIEVGGTGNGYVDLHVNGSKADYDMRITVDSAGIHFLSGPGTAGALYTPYELHTGVIVPTSDVLGGSCTVKGSLIAGTSGHLVICGPNLQWAQIY